MGGEGGGEGNGPSSSPRSIAWGWAQGTHTMQIKHLLTS